MSLVTVSVSFAAGVVAGVLLTLGWALLCHARSKAVADRFGRAADELSEPTPERRRGRCL